MKGLSTKLIGVFRALKLGDLLCSVPAFRALRMAYPHASLSFIGLPWAQSFVDRFPQYFDEFISFPGYPGLPEQSYDAEKTLSFLEKMQQKNFDIVFQMHGKGTVVNPMIALWNAKRVVGYFDEKNDKTPKGVFFPYGETQHEIVRWITLLQKFGIPSYGTYLELPIKPDEERLFHRLKKIFSLEKNNYICFHAGSISGERWDVANFIHVAKYLYQKGFKIVLTGTANDKAINTVIQRNLGFPCVNLTGLTEDLGVLTQVIKQASLLVCNDTGVSHIAAATKTPSIILFQSSDPHRWAPLDTSLHRAITTDNNGVKTVLKEIDILLARHSSSQFSYR